MTDELKEFLKNVDRIHTTPTGFKRIMKNLNITLLNPMAWCKTKIEKSNWIRRVGKNWYVYSGDVIFVINASTYNIVTAHKTDIKF